MKMEKYLDYIYSQTTEIYLNYSPEATNKKIIMEMCSTLTTQMLAEFFCFEKNTKKKALIIFFRKVLIFYTLYVCGCLHICIEYDVIHIGIFVSLEYLDF